MYFIKPHVGLRIFLLLFLSLFTMLAKADRIDDRIALFMELSSVVDCSAVVEIEEKLKCARQDCLNYMMPCSNDFSNINFSLAPLNECSNAETVHLSADIGGLSDLIVAIDVPIGQIDFKGNVQGGTILSSDPLMIALDIDNASFNLQFDIQALCGVSDNNRLSFDFVYTGGAGSCEELSTPLIVDDVSVFIASPNTPGRITEDQLVSVLNEVDTLTVTIVQEGNGFLDSLYYYVEDHDLLQLEKLIDCNTGIALEHAFTDGDRHYYWIGEDQVGVDGFVRNEGIVICEIWKTIACPQEDIALINHGVVTSCSLSPMTDICDEDAITAALDFGALTPELTHYVDLDTGFDPTCISSNGQRQAWFLVNTGTAPVGATEIYFTEFGGATPIDISSFMYQVGSGGSFRPFDPSTSENEILSSNSDNIRSCTNTLPNQDNLHNRIRLGISDISLAVDDTLFVHYDIYPSPCNCSGCDVVRRFGVDIEDVHASTLCGEEVQVELLREDVVWPSYNVGYSSFMESPVMNCAGEVSTLSTTITSYTNDYLSNQGNNGQDDDERTELHDILGSKCTDCYIEMVYTIPFGLDFVDGGAVSIIWRDDDGTIWNPTSYTYTDNNTGEDILTLRWIGQAPSGFDAFNEASGVFFDYTPDCTNELESNNDCGPITYNDAIRHTVYWSSGDCSTCAVETLRCEQSLDVTIKCPGTETDCNCAGFAQSYGTASRTNRYLPDTDNNGTPDIGDPYDELILRTDRFIRGDSIEVRMGGVLHTTSVQNQFEYLYAEIEMPYSEFLPLGAALTIYADNQEYTCDVLTQTIELGDKLITDLSISRLQANGCIVPDQYKDGDSIALKVYYSTQNEYEGEIVQWTSRTQIFASNDPYGGSRFSCRIPFDYRMSQVGIQQDFDYNVWRINNLSGCLSGTAFYRGYSRIGSANLDFFPGEYIGFINHIDQVNVSIPEGLQFDFFRIYIRRKNASAWNRVGGRISSYGSHVDIRADNPAITIVGDALIFSMDDFMLDLTGDRQLPYSDEGYSFSMEPFFIANCNLAVGPIEDVNIGVNHVTNSKILGSSTYTSTGTLGNLDYEGGASLAIDVIDDFIVVDQFPKCSRIRVRNTGTSLANNVWLTFNSSSGLIIPEKLSDITGDANMELTGGDFDMYQLGNLSPGEIKLYELCVYPNICDIDSLEVFTGYDCQSYPSFLEEAQCFDTSSIEFQPMAGGLFMTSKVPSEDYILKDQCDTLDYVVDISASGPGYIDDILLNINLPLNMKLVPGSFEIAFPTTADANSIPPDSEFEPANDPTYLYGNTYQMNVTDEDSDLDIQGLIGSDGSAFNLNVINVRYKTFTECGFASGSRVYYEASASEGCGRELNPIQLDFSSKAAIFDAPSPFISKVNFEGAELNACSNDETTISIDYTINGMQSTLDEDSLRIILPAGIHYVPGSYTFGTSPNTEPPLVKTEDSLEILYWGISGLEVGETAKFSIDIMAQDIGQPCRMYPILVQTYKAGKSFCDATGEECIVRSISDEKMDYITILKPELVIQSAIINAMSAGTEEIVMLSARISNVGSAVATTQESIIMDLYDDIDGDGRITDGVDVFLDHISSSSTIGIGETIEISGTINLPAGSTCSLLATIDISKNCSCTPSTSAKITSELDLKYPKTFSVCSNEILDVGPESIDAFSYEWISIDGSDVAALSDISSTPITFNFDNNTGQELLWQYGLRVTRGTGCYTYDTIDIVIHPEIDQAISLDICRPIDDCTDQISGFGLVGPLQGSSFNWSVESGDFSADINDPNSNTTLVNTIINARTTFLLQYLDNNGCNASFRQEVNLLNCACTSLGDTVWYDFNVNGIQDMDEPGIEGITVYLYAADDLTVPLQFTTTDADGHYSFKPLVASNYVVRFDHSNYTGSYNSLSPTLQNIGDDALDSDFDPITGFTESYFIANGVSDTTVDAGFYPAFDLALTKEVNTDRSPGPYFSGDVIHYQINIYNQGAYYEGTNIRVQDYIPSSMTYIAGTSGSVTSFLGDELVITNLGDGIFEIDRLAPADRVTLDISLMLDADFSGDVVDNFAEITSFTNQYNLVDIDSNADNIPDNDGGGIPNAASDNSIVGDGSGLVGSDVATTDEDDHDPAQIEIRTVDLALRKTVDESYNAQPIPAGEKVKFDITVFNQGEVSVSAIDIQEYIPSAYVFDSTDPLNIANGWDIDGKATINETLHTGDNTTISLYLTALYSANTQDYINAAEITAAYDTVTGRDIAPYDIDSRPGTNSIQENSVTPGTVGDNNISSTSISDIGSEDDHDIEIIDIAYVDVALTKIIDPDYELSSLTYGDSIPFIITIFNQGNINAGSITVVDYIPPGFTFDSTISGNEVWSLVDNGIYKTEILNLTKNSQLETKIWLRLQPSDDVDRWVNEAEISQFIDDTGQDRSHEDIDSPLNMNASDNIGGFPNSAADDAIMGDGTGVVDGIDPAKDADNSDPASVHVFDLALSKMVVNDAPHGNGDVLDFSIKVYNQGNVAASQVIIADSIPSGFAFVSVDNAGWTGTLPLIQYEFPQTILPGEHAEVILKLRLIPGDGTPTAFTNIAEIISANNLLNTILSDADSTSDIEFTNDAGGKAGTESDNQLDGNGINDEDDHDPARIDVFDLALAKSTSTSGPYRYGDLIQFDIEITNQGNITADNISVTDHIPCGYQYMDANNAAWDYDENTRIASTTIGDTLAGGESVTISLYLSLVTCESQNAYLNIAEITGATDANGITHTDIDSTPDNIANNDGTPVDNEIYNSGGDQDDHDIENLEIFDLALRKTILENPPYAYGDTLTFQIEVFNQGNVSARDIQVVDYIPDGYTFDGLLNPDWNVSNAPVYTYEIASLAAGDSTQIYMQVRLQESTGGSDSYTNYAEILEAKNIADIVQVDADSTPDNIINNDKGGVPNGLSDDQIDGNGIDDEDDHDPAIIEVFDLALIKQISNLNPTTGVTFGQNIAYELVIYNQGNVPASDVTLVDHIPVGYSFDPDINMGWSGAESTPTILSYTIPDVIQPGDSNTVLINLEILQIDTGEYVQNYENTAEILSAMNDTGAPVIDIDSTPDNNPENDGVVIDDEIHNNQGDQDDHDVAIPPFIDLALRKTLAQEYQNIQVGDEVAFEITIFNQGTIPADEILVTDYLPDGLSLSVNDNNTWDTSTAPILSKTISDVLMPGDSVKLYLLTKVEPFTQLSDYINIAEISQYQDLAGNMPLDFDSTPDRNPTNDVGGQFNTPSDNHIIDDGADTDGDGIRDEDDHDIEAILIFDLALKNITYQQLPVLIGDDVEFEITVYNQGNVDAEDITISDYIPTGFVLSPNDNNDWMEVDPDRVELKIDKISILDSVKVKILLTVQEGATIHDLISIAEVSEAYDSFGNNMSSRDIDSSLDSIVDNDIGGVIESINDNEINGNAYIGEDEDDHDPARPPVFDLALRKRTTSDLPPIPGDLRTHQFVVYNQGSMSAHDIMINDYIPSGLRISPTDMNNWTSINDSLLTMVIPGPLEAGDSISITIDMIVQVGATIETLINNGEINQTFDIGESDMSNWDIDSQADDIRTNDIGGSTVDGTDDHIDDDGKDTDGDGLMDEDDQDIAAIPVFDLALTLTTPLVAVSQDELVEFTFEICNQGTEDAANIVVADYIPLGLAFVSDTRNEDWDDTDPLNPIYIYKDTLIPGSCDQFSIFLSLIDNDPLSLINMGEIVAATDGNGDDRTGRDLDSVNDNDNTNDNGNDPFSTLDNINNQNGRAGEDEDDHDQAWVMVCTDISCSGYLNIGLDSLCSITFSPSFLINPKIYPDSLYEIVIRDLDGNIRPSSSFTLDDLNTTFFVDVSIPLCNNQTCTSTILVEDKFAPEITCPNDITVNCMNLEDLPLPIIVDNCGGAELVLLEESMDDLGGCDTDYISRIRRRYKAVDGQGNESAECSFDIYIERLPLDEVILPQASFQLIQGTALECGDVFELDSNGFPSPNVTGVPTYQGVPLEPNAPFSSCGIFVIYKDLDLGTASCVQTISRLWTIGEHHCDTIRTRKELQKIQIVDRTGPVITCPSDMTISTDAYLSTCEALVNMPIVEVSDACNTEDITLDIDYEGGYLNDQNGGVIQLTLGDHAVNYIAHDACGNSTICTVQVHVIDASKPTAVCTEDIAVSLNSSGIAILTGSSIDNGSVDDCMIDRWEIRRMNDNCGIASNMVLGSEVTFCCSDAGTEQPVLMRVYDVSGNYNECIVSVTVQDPEIPILSIPMDMTIDCTTTLNEDNLSQLFGQASVSDNCASEEMIAETLQDNRNSCGIGSVIRTFSVSDGHGGQTIDSQILYFENNNPFDGTTSIVWPINVVLTNTACTVADVLPDNLPNGMDRPVITKDDCDQIASNYSDEIFNNGAGAASCYTILRTWTVIDWCNRAEDGSIPTYEYGQLLEINNTVAPTITSDTGAMVVETIDTDCQSGDASLILTATDDCPDQGNINISFSIDLNNDGSIDMMGTSNDASGTYAVGVHSIRWEVSDGCGNTSFVSYTFEIRNKKSPSAVCIQGLSSDVVPTDTNGDGTMDTEQVILSPLFFDGGSGHDCGLDIRLSFSADDNDTVRIYDCDDIGQQTVTLWVTDTNGNQDFCTTSIEIIDNNDEEICTDRNRLLGIQGNIWTIGEKPIIGVEVAMQSIDTTIISDTDQEGSYYFGMIPEGGSYDIIPNKEDGILKGVSTLDLVLIQKHLSGISSLSGAYQRIAGDIDNSGGITSLDLIELREVMLGIRTLFSNNKSWRFIDKGYTFVDAENPWDEYIPESYNIGTLERDMKADFVGVKIGDIDNSVANEYGFGIEEENRNLGDKEPLVLQLTDRNISDRSSEIRLPIMSRNFKGIEGMQFTIELEGGLELTGIEGSSIRLDQRHISLDSTKTQGQKKVYRLSWNDEGGREVHIDREIPLCFLQITAPSGIRKTEQRLRELLQLSSVSLASEYYKASSVAGTVEIAYRIEIEDQKTLEAVRHPFAVHQNKPNPWIDKTTIALDIPKDGMVQYIVRDLQDRVILSRQERFTVGHHNISLDQSDVQIGSGLLVLEVLYEGQRRRIQMIKIK